MEELRDIPLLAREHKMDLLAVTTPTRLPKRLYLKQVNPTLHYDPKTPEKMTQSHREMKKLLDYFQNKTPTDTMFADHALEVFLNVDWYLYPIWATKIEVTMEEIFPLLDTLGYGHDTILLLSVISPSSYRILYKPTPKGTPPHIPTFTLEYGITGAPLARTVNLKLRKATFYEEVTKVTRTLKTTRFVSFMATQMQADFHGAQLTIAAKEIRRVFWALESDTPDKDKLDVAYEVLCMMRSSRSSQSKICLATDQVQYCLVTHAWYTVPRQTQEDLPSPQPKEEKPKVSSAKKREDTKNRVRKLRAKKVADKNSYRTVSDLNSSVEFQRELRSRSSSIVAARPQNQQTNHSPKPVRSCKATMPTKSQSPGKYRC